MLCLSRASDTGYDSGDSLVDVNRVAEVRNSLFGLIFVTAVLLIGGIVMLYSASYGQAGLKYFRNQLIWSCLGMVCGVITILFTYRRVAKYSLSMVAMCFIALLVAALCFRKINGASRWICLGPVSIQPSEFAKIVVAVFVAKYCADNYRSFYKFKDVVHGLIPLIAGVGFIVIGVALGHDLGTTLLITSGAFVTMLAAGLPLRWLLFSLPCLFVLTIYLRFFDNVRWARVTSFLHPESVQSGTGYQLWTSLMALGSGNWFGVGFTAGRMKERYLPEAHTDFVLSVTGEELGYCGMLSVIFLYTLWGYFGLRIALRANTRLGKLLGFAIVFIFCTQAAINISVISGSIPTKGMPAPFLSYGGSNLMSALIATGLLCSIALEVIHPEFPNNLYGFLKKFFRGGAIK